MKLRLPKFKFSHDKKRDVPMSDPSAQDLGRRSIIGAVIMLGGQGVSIAIQLANVYVLGHLLEPDDFGVFALAMIFVSISGIFSDLGLSVAAIQAEKLDQNVASGLFFINLALGTAAMIVCLFAAPIAGWYFDEEAVFWAIITLAATIPLSAATVQFNAMLVRGMCWREIQIVTITSQLAGFAAGALSAWYGAGYMALVIAASALVVSKLIVAGWLARWWPSRVTDWSVCWAPIRFGANYTGFMLCNLLHKQADVFLIGYYWGVRETGYYNRAYQLMSMPLNAVSGPLGSVFLPTLSRLQGNLSRWSQAFVRATLMTAMVGCAAAVVLMVSAASIIHIVLGPGWDEVAQLFRWLSLSMIFTFPMGAAAWAFTSLGRTKPFFHWGLLSTGVLLVAFAASAPFGVERVAQAYTAVTCMLTPVCFAMALKGSGLRVRVVIAELALLWVAAALGVVTGSLAPLSSDSLIAELVIRSIVTLGAYVAALVPLFLWRMRYRQIANEVWSLARSVSL